MAQFNSIKDSLFNTEAINSSYGIVDFDVLNITRSNSNQAADGNPVNFDFNADANLIPYHHNDYPEEGFLNSEVNSFQVKSIQNELTPQKKMQNNQYEAVENYVFNGLMNYNEFSRKNSMDSAHADFKEDSDFNNLLESAWNFNEDINFSSNQFKTADNTSNVSPKVKIAQIKQVDGYFGTIDDKGNKYYNLLPNDTEVLSTSVSPSPTHLSGSSTSSIPTSSSEVLNHLIVSNKKRGRKSSNSETKEIDSDRFKIIDTPALKQANIKLRITESSVTCLSIGIDYGGYTGLIAKLDEDHPDLINNYFKPHNSDNQKRRALVLYPEYANPISSISPVKQRIKYTRNIDALPGAIKNIVYKTSSVYNLLNPYEPQYYRFELDNDGELINETKCGMCPYCEDVKFLPFKNSSYLSHLTLEHGIFSNNYLTPNGLYYGKYSITRKEKSGYGSKKIAKTREVDGIQCPHCFEVIEVGCWSMKSNKLLSYFRHFKNEHGDEIEELKKDAIQTPSIQARGRTLKVIN